MARQGRQPRRQVRGFRPGKEPPHLRKRMAKQDLGQMSAGQERLADLFASRSSAEGRALVRRWIVGMLTAAVVLLVAGALLYAWSVVAGVLVHVLALLALFVWWQLGRQREGLNAMADTLGTGGGGPGRKKR